jgi:hypothetical protein
MTEAGMSAKLAHSSRPTPVTAEEVGANILRRFAEVSAAIANFFRPSRHESAQGQAETGAVDPELLPTRLLPPM